MSRTRWPQQFLEEAAQEVEAMSIDASDERRAEFWEIDHPGLALEELEKAFVRVREKGEKAWQDEYRIFFEKECARSERLVDSEMVEKRSQDKSLLALFPDFFRGEEAVEYKLMSNTDEREVVHQSGFAERRIGRAESTSHGRVEQPRLGQCASDNGVVRKRARGVGSDGGASGSDERQQNCRWPTGPLALSSLRKTCCCCNSTLFVQ